MKAIALLNKKTQPNTLSVGGSFTTYNGRDTVQLEFATPQGTNPTILLLDVIINEVDGPKKGTDKPFFYEQIENAAKFKQVELRYDGGHHVIEVAELK